MVRFDFGRWPTVLIATWTVLVLTGCDASLERAQHRLRVGYAVEAPYAFVTNDGTVSGESPEIARLVAKRLGLAPISWRQFEFRELLDALIDDRIDVIAAGMFVTPERQKRVAFSRPTFSVQEAFLSRTQTPFNWSNFYPPTGGTIPRLVILEGAWERTFLVENGWSEASLFEVPDALTGLRLVQEGRYDALVLSAPTLRTLAFRGAAGSLQVTVPGDPRTNPRSVGAFAFRPQDQALRQAWDQILEGWVGSEEHLRIVAPYGFTLRELP